jgi:hypothetical protein
VKANIFGKWQMKYELMILNWSLYWLALHEQEELDNGLALMKD